MYFCQNNIDMQKSRTHVDFGRYLKDLRIKAGFKSLQKAVDYHPGVFSKATLNLVENGQFLNLSPEQLHFFSRVYKIAYEEVATAWFKYRYNISELDILTRNSFIRNINPEKISLSVSARTEKENLTIISTDELMKVQGKLPRNSKVTIVTSRFLDDDSFFNMVTANLLKNIQYIYLLPSQHFPIYQNFIQKAELKHKSLKGKLDKKLCRFYERSDYDFPMNYVLHVFPTGEIQGYIGLLYDHMVQYFQVADSKLSWRIFSGFKWGLKVAKDDVIKKRFFELNQTI